MRRSPSESGLRNSDPGSAVDASDAEASLGAKRRRRRTLPHAAVHSALDEELPECHVCHAATPKAHKFVVLLLDDGSVQLLGNCMLVPQVSTRAEKAFRKHVDEAYVCLECQRSFDVVQTGLAEPPLAEAPRQPDAAQTGCAACGCAPADVFVVQRLDEAGSTLLLRDDTSYFPFAGGEPARGALIDQSGSLISSMADAIAEALHGSGPSGGTLPLCVECQQGLEPVAEERELFDDTNALVPPKPAPAARVAKRAARKAIPNKTGPLRASSPNVKASPVDIMERASPRTTVVRRPPLELVIDDCDDDGLVIDAGVFSGSLGVLRSTPILTLCMRRCCHRFSSCCTTGGSRPGRFAAGAVEHGEPCFPVVRFVWRRPFSCRQNKQRALRNVWRRHSRELCQCRTRSAHQQPQTVPSRPRRSTLASAVVADSG